MKQFVVINCQSEHKQTPSKYFRLKIEELQSYMEECKRNVAQLAILKEIERNVDKLATLIGEKTAGHLIDMYLQYIQEDKVRLNGNSDYYDWNYNNFIQMKSKSVSALKNSFQYWKSTDLKCNELLLLLSNKLHGRNCVLYCENLFISKSLFYILTSLELFDISSIFIDDGRQMRKRYVSSQGIFITTFDDFHNLDTLSSNLVLVSIPKSLIWSGNVYFLNKNNSILENTSLLELLTPLQTVQTYKAFASNGKQSSQLVTKEQLIECFETVIDDSLVSIDTNISLTYQSQYQLVILQGTLLSFGFLTDFEDLNDINCSYNAFKCTVHSISLTQSQFESIKAFSKYLQLESIVLIHNNMINYLEMENILENKTHLKSFARDFINFVQPAPVDNTLSNFEYGWLYSYLYIIENYNELFILKNISHSSNGLVFHIDALSSITQLQVDATQLFPVQLHKDVYFEMKKINISHFAGCLYAINAIKPIQTVSNTNYTITSIVNDDKQLFIGKLISRLFNLKATTNSQFIGLAHMIDIYTIPIMNDFDFFVLCISKLFPSTLCISNSCSTIDIFNT